MNGKRVTADKNLEKMEKERAACSDIAKALTCIALDSSNIEFKSKFLVICQSSDLNEAQKKIQDRLEAIVWKTGDFDKKKRSRKDAKSKQESKSSKGSELEQLIFQELQGDLDTLCSGKS